jgi:hypothetical protein
MCGLFLSLTSLTVLCCGGMALGDEGAKPVDDAPKSGQHWVALGIVTDAAPLVVEVKDSVVAVVAQGGVVEVVVAGPGGEPTITHEPFQGMAMVLADADTGNLRLVAMMPDASGEPGESPATAATSGGGRQGGNCWPSSSVYTQTCTTTMNVLGPGNSTCTIFGCRNDYADGSYYSWFQGTCSSGCGLFSWSGYTTHNVSTQQHCVVGFASPEQNIICNGPQ